MFYQCPFLHFWSLVKKSIENPTLYSTRKGSTLWIATWHQNRVVIGSEISRDNKGWALLGCWRLSRSFPATNILQSVVPRWDFFAEKMTKRACPFPETFSSQYKIHVGQQELNNYSVFGNKYRQEIYCKYIPVLLANASSLVALIGLCKFAVFGYNQNTQITMEQSRYSPFVHLWNLL